MKPSVGRIVHYVTAKLSHRPAIVTHVWEDGTCSLRIFTVQSLDWMAPFDLDKVPEGPPAMVGAWHWPERES
jgi:hypothetical protein